MGEEFHDLVTFVGDCFVWLWKLGESPSIVPRLKGCAFFAHIRGYLLTAVLEYPLYPLESTLIIGYFRIRQKV
jgi:hypothetical protein